MLKVCEFSKHFATIWSHHISCFLSSPYIKFLCCDVVTLCAQYTNIVSTLLKLLFSRSMWRNVLKALCHSSTSWIQLFLGNVFFSEKGKPQIIQLYELHWGTHILEKLTSWKLFVTKLLTEFSFSFEFFKWKGKNSNYLTLWISLKIILEKLTSGTLLFPSLPLPAFTFFLK